MYNVYICTLYMRPFMKKRSRLLIRMLTIIVLGFHLTTSAATLGSSDRFSEWMTRSEMKRTPNSYLLDFSSSPKWSYVMGIELESMLDTYLRYGGEDIRKYCQDYTDKMINTKGSIKGYNLTDYNLDNVRTGHFVTRMYELYPENKNLIAIQTLMSQLDKQPRTDEGVYWHKAIYAWQVWLDGIFMGLPFRVLTASQLYDTHEATAIYDDAVEQVKKTYLRTLDEQTGLNRHAWDETHEMFWADKETGLSQHCWGRAQGWYTMALVELLEALPSDYPRRDEIIEILVRCFDSILKWQDTSTNTWYQVMDSPERSGNYLEATASCMFAYSLLKAARMGWVDKYYQQEGLKAYDGIVTNFIKQNNDGTISLTNCCSVAGLGPGISEKVLAAAPYVSENRRRDGSFEYYLSEPVRDNDPKGIGPFIWASIEREIVMDEMQSSINLPEIRDVNDNASELYNIHGIKIADNITDAINNLPAGVYIRRQGDITTKYVISH